MFRRTTIITWPTRTKKAFLIAGLSCLFCNLLLSGCEDSSPNGSTDQPSTPNTSGQLLPSDSAKSEKNLTEAHLSYGDCGIKEIHKRLTEKLVTDGLQSKVTESEANSLTFLVKILKGQTKEHCVQVVVSSFEVVMQKHSDEFYLTLPSISLGLGDGTYLEFTINKRGAKQKGQEP